MDRPGPGGRTPCPAAAFAEGVGLDVARPTPIGREQSQRFPGSLVWSRAFRSGRLRRPRGLSVADERGAARSPWPTAAQPWLTGTRRVALLGFHPRPKPLSWRSFAGDRCRIVNGRRIATDRSIGRSTYSDGAVETGRRLRPDRRGTDAGTCTVAHIDARRRIGGAGFLRGLEHVSPSRQLSKTGRMHAQSGRGEEIRSRRMVRLGSRHSAS